MTPFAYLAATPQTVVIEPRPPIQSNFEQLNRLLGGSATTSVIVRQPQLEEDPWLATTNLALAQEAPGPVTVTFTGPSNYWLVAEKPQSVRDEMLWVRAFADRGTRITNRLDLSYSIDSSLGPSIEIDTRTRMAKIKDLARLSSREWATALNVSHQSIQDWSRKEPDRPELDTVLRFLEKAARQQSRLDEWLRAPLAPLSTRPVDLIKGRNWEALNGALRVATPPLTAHKPSEIVKRRREEWPWATIEPVSEPDE